MGQIPDPVPVPAVPPPDSRLASTFAPYPREERGAGTAQFRRYLAAVLRYRWLVVGVALLGVLAGVAAMRFVKPLYLAQATIWVEATQPDQAESGPIRSGQLLESYAWIELLRSYVVLDNAVQELRLYVRPAEPRDSLFFSGFSLDTRFVPGQYAVEVDGTRQTVALFTGTGGLVEQAAVGDSVGRRIGFRWVPPAERLVPGSRVEFAVEHPRDAARELDAQLNVTADRQGNFLRVELQGDDPATVAASVNAVIRRFVDVAAQLKREKLSELVSILDEQLRRAKRRLDSAETELEGFRVRTITLPSERASPVAPGLEVTQDPVLDNYFNMQVTRDQFRRDREAIERVLTQLPDSGIPTGALEAIGAVQQSSELTAALTQLTDRRADLRALALRYTADAPQVQRVRADVETLERRTIPDLAQLVIVDLRARERTLDEQVASASADLRQIPPRRINEARLERDAEIASSLYTRLQERYEEASLAEASSIPDVRILDEATVPRLPLSNRAPLFLMAGVAGGLGLAILGAILLDRVDRRVQYPEQVTEQMGLSILGVIPHFKGATNGKPRHHPGTQPVIEALRGIRLNLEHAYGAAGPLLVTVTSPGSGDGKSFLAANLALAFADAGHRTILIDGDGRRGALHRVLNAGRKPGLTDILSKRVSRDDAIQPTAYPSLSFVGSGTRLPSGPELLASGAMAELVTSLRGLYQTIIIDSPPLGAGVDAFALGTVTGNMVIVLRTGSTDREEAEAKLDLLDRLPVRVLGAVLNDVKGGKAYGYRYYSYYLPGYEHESEEESEAAGGARKGLLGGATR